MIDAPHTGTDVQIQAVGQPSAIRRILPDTDDRRRHRRFERIAR
jgi:hypothetical protein